MDYINSNYYLQFSIRRRGVVSQNAEASALPLGHALLICVNCLSLVKEWLLNKAESSDDLIRWTIEYVIVPR